MENAAEELRRRRLANLRPRPRVKGQPNRISRDLRQAIIDAGALHGADGQGKGGLAGYLFMLAGRYPKAYISLLGRLIPLQLDGAINSVSEVRIVSVPSGHYLGAEANAGMSALSETVLDHDDDAPDTLIEAASDLGGLGSVDDTVEHIEAKASGRAIVRSLLKPIAGS